MASTYLTRNHTCSASTFTYSTWIKVCDLSTAYQYFFSYEAAGSGNAYGLALDGATNTMYYYGSGANYTAQKVRDPSAWYHVVLKVTSGTGILYINGEEAKTSISVQSFSSGESMNVGAYVYGSNVNYHFDGYMSETHFIDGTAYAPTTFGQTDTTGVWVPIVAPSVTYGTNGFYLKFANSGAMGTDSSGNSNTFSVGNGNVMQVGDTPTNNFPTFNPLGTDSGLGLGSANLRAFTSNSQSYPHIMSNFAVKSGKWYLETLRSANSVTGGMGVFNTLTDSSGNPTEKYMYYTTGNKDTNGSQSAYGASWGQGDLISTTYDATNGQVSFYKNGVSQGVAFTLDTSKYWQFGIQSYTQNTQEDIINFGQEGTFIGNKTAGGNADANGYGNFFYTVPTGFLALCTQNMSTELTIPVNKGADNFNTITYTGTGSTQSMTGVGFQPDFVWLKSRSNTHYHNLYDSVRGATRAMFSNSTDDEVIEAGNLQSFISDGFTAGGFAGTNGSSKTYVAWNWKAGTSAPANTYAVKVVSDSGNKYRFDDYGTSAITLELQEGGTFTFDQSDASNAGHPLRFSSTSDGTHGGGSEYTTGVTTTGTPGQAGAKTVITVAGSAPTLYYYCSVHSGMGGQANTGSLFGFTNVKGTLQGVVSPNTTAGFSVVTYTGTGANATVGHGLGKAPNLVIVKLRSGGSSWAVYSRAVGATKVAYLESTSAFFVSGGNSFWNDTNPTSSVFSLGNEATVNSSGGTLVAYCFADIEGYSKIGTYTGNGSTDGPFVYTGFRPAWVMRKSSSNAETWSILDSTRSAINAAQDVLKPNTNDAEGSATWSTIDILSNGFKMRATDASTNGSGNTYIYMAFAENPLVTSTGKPVTAR